jgi:hypothetical protein
MVERAAAGRLSCSRSRQSVTLTGITNVVSHRVQMVCTIDIFALFLRDSSIPLLLTGTSLTITFRRRHWTARIALRTPAPYSLPSAPTLPQL